MKIGVRNRKVRKILDVKMRLVNWNYNMALAKLGKNKTMRKFHQNVNKMSS